MTTDAIQSGHEECQLSLVVPCYNEAGSLNYSVPALTRTFQSAGVTFELILVHNGSSDGTGDRIDQLAQLGFPVRKVVVAVNQGKGHGVLQGLAAARGHWVGILDADLPVAPHDVLLVFQLAAACPQAVLSTVHRRFRLDGWRRAFFSALFNVQANLLFGGLGTSDINANPKIWPRAMLPQMQLSSRGWALDLELVLNARKLGLAILTVNALSQPRAVGTSRVVNWRASLQLFGELIRFRFAR